MKFQIAVFMCHLAGGGSWFTLQIQTALKQLHSDALTLWFVPIGTPPSVQRGANRKGSLSVRIINHSFIIF